jgi:HD-like signal output (HDOD) protein
VATKGSRPVLDLKKTFSGAQLPALPQSAIRLLEMSQNEDNGPVEFAVPIEADPGLTVQVLRFVNSSYFGFSRTISSVKLAISLVGVRTIKNFALWSAVFSLLPNPKCGPFDLKSLWQDSLRRALLARAMARLLGMKDTEEAFAAALLQDLAVPLLAKESPDVYLRLLQTRQQEHVRLSVLESQLFGWTHAEAAGMVARQWKLPETFALLIEGHTEVDRWAAQGVEEPGRLAVALSALLPSTTDATWTEFGLLEVYYRRIAPAGSPALADLCDQVDCEYTQFAPVLKIANPNKSLRACLEEMVVTA